MYTKRVHTTHAHRAVYGGVAHIPYLLSSIPSELMAIQWTWNWTWNTIYICRLASKSFRSSLLCSIDCCISSIDYSRMDVYTIGMPTNVFIFFSNSIYIERVPFHFPSISACMHIAHGVDLLSMSHINNRILKIRRTALKIAYDIGRMTMFAL